MTKLLHGVYDKASSVELKLLPNVFTHGKKIIYNNRAVAVWPLCPDKVASVYSVNSVFKKVG